jgi:hypothetical protein
VTSSEVENRELKPGRSPADSPPYDLTHGVEEPVDLHPARIAGQADPHQAPSGSRGKRAVAGLVPLAANEDRKSYAAPAKGPTSSIVHLAMTFATDFEVQLNG